MKNEPAYHVATPAELARYEDARGIVNAVGDDDLLDLVAKSIFDSLAEILELLDLLLALLLLLFGLFEFETLLAHAYKLFALEFLELGHCVLVDRIDEEQNFEAFLLEDLEEGRVLNARKTLACQVIDGLLNLRHPRDVV